MSIPNSAPPARPSRGFDWRPVLFGLLACLLALNATLARTPGLDGDGVEYFMMSHALLSRGEPSLQPQDIRALERAVRRAGTGLDLINEMLAMKPEDLTGYHRSTNGRLYSYHFWFYPLVNVPALAASRLLGFVPTRSFLITNTLLVLLASFLVLFRPAMPPWARGALLLMFLSGGASFYLDWSGPEMLTACALLAGGVFFLEGRLLVAALLLAVASQQNPPVAPLVAVTLGIWLWRTASALKRGEIPFRILAPSIAGALAITVFTLLSPLFYWSHFGVPSLLVAHGSAETKFITFNRLLSYYFDFDQGLVRGAPFLLGGLAVSLMIALMRARASLRWILGGLGLIAASIIIALPSLTTVTWVAGCRVYLRYAFWGSIPLWLAAVTFLRAATPRQRAAVLGAALAGQFAWIALVYRGDGKDVSIREHAWLTRQVIERFPEHYNPDPFIFAVRTVRSWVLPFQPAPGLAYYFEHPGRISKLFYHTESRNNWIPECAATPADLEKAPGVERIPADGGWTYLNLGQACPLNNGHPAATFWLSYSDRYHPLDAEGIPFGRGRDWESHVWENQTGWGGAEDWGVWTDGPAAQVSFLLARPPEGPMTLAITAIGRPADGQIEQACDIYANGIFVGPARFPANARSTVRLPLPATLLARSSGIFHLRMQMQGVGKPALGVISVNLEPAGGAL